MESIIIYLTVFLVATFFLTTGNKYKSAFNLFTVIGLGILIVFAAGRYRVGTDIITYSNIFERLTKTPWGDIISRNEFLFWGISKITYSIGGRVLTWGIFAALIVIPVYSALHKQYPKLYMGTAFFSFLCFYYAISFNITRQMIAVALVFWGLKFVYENKFFSFLTIIIIASGFHVSVWVAILIWFLWDHKNNCPVKGKKSVLLLLLVVLSVWGYQMIVEYMSEHISIFSDYDAYTETSTVGKNRDFYLSAFELVLFWLISVKNKDIDQDAHFMFILMTISVLIGITGFTHPQVKRVAYYFSLPSKTVLFGYMPQYFVKKSKGVSAFLLVLYAAFVFIIVAYFLGESHLIPYRFDLTSKL